MSHFFTIVVLPFGSTNDSAAEICSMLLEPFDENKETEPYEEECWCKRGKIREMTSKEGDAKFGSWDDMRSAMDAKHGPNPSLEKPWNECTEEELEAHRKLELDRQEIWEKKYYRPRMDWEKERAAELSPDVQADKDCEECSGTGTRRSTYNPDSKWDWWRVGGRWDGAIRALPALEDEDRGFNFGGKFESTERNVTTTDAVLEKGISPFAILTPDGAWHESGEMGWWGIVTDRKDEATWDETVKAILRAYPGHLAVGCDLHI